MQPAESIAAHYLVELEKLLRRVEESVTHYEVLGIQPSAAAEEVRLAHQWSTTLLSPSKYGITVELGQTMKERTARVTERISNSFSVVANQERRRQYDRALNNFSPPAPSTDLARDLTPASKGVVANSGPHPNAMAATEGTDVGAWQRANSDNRRRSDRVKLSMPAQVTGYSRTAGKWTEMAQTVDVSKLGAAIRMRTKVRPGTVLFLNIPLPLKLRNHGQYESSYHVFAIVRRVDPLQNGFRVIRLRFLGKEPPAGFLEKPWATFRSGSWQGVQRRREPRENKTEAVTIQYLDGMGNAIRSDIALSENVSERGARLRLKVPPPEFETVIITNRRLGFTRHAVVCDLGFGRGGIEFLSLCFTEAKLPSR
jgi:hypothetical protein